MYEEPFFKTPYNHDREQESAKTGTPNDEPSMTKQEFAEECDINTIVRRFGLLGELPTSFRMPAYDDYTGVNDYHTALNIVRQAGENFMELPAELRARFGNDPQKFLEFCSDEANRAEAAKLGLLSEQALQAAADLAVVNTAMNIASEKPALQEGAKPPLETKSTDTK